MRTPGLKLRWPPGFSAGILTGVDAHDFYFRNEVDCNNCAFANNDRVHDYIDLSIGQPVVPVYRGRRNIKALGEARFWEENQFGDIRLDHDTRRLVAIRGAKMAPLAETRWYAIDRIPLAELRKLVQENPVESIALPAFSDVTSPESRRTYRKMPTLVVQTTRGRIVLVRAGKSGRSDELQIRGRPRASFYPFRPADEDYEPSPALLLAPLETTELFVDRFARALAAQKLPFVGPAQMEELCTELHDYLEVHVGRPLWAPHRKSIVQASTNSWGGTLPMPIAICDSAPVSTP